MSRLPFVVLLGLSLLACGKHKEAPKPQAQTAEPAKVPVSEELAGTPFEAVANAQAQLASIFDPQRTPDVTTSDLLSMVRSFRDKAIVQFRADCDAQRRWYAEDPAKRILQRANAGALWRDLKAQMRARAEIWGTADKRAVDIYIDEFTCE